VGQHGNRPVGSRTESSTANGLPRLAKQYESSASGDHCRPIARARRELRARGSWHGLRVSQKQCDVSLCSRVACLFFSASVSGNHAWPRKDHISSEPGQTTLLIIINWSPGHRSCFARPNAASSPDPNDHFPMAVMKYYGSSVLSQESLSSPP
jgi:hypothetical protein